MKQVVNLQAKNIVITGASSGIGRACAILCSELDANVVLIGRNTTRLEETKSLMKTGQHIVLSLDVCNFADIENNIKNVVDTLGKIDGFIYAAGMEMTRPLKILKQEQLLETFMVNVFAGFEFAKVITKNKYINDSASLVFIASIVGIFGQSGKIAYSASKGAVVAGAKSMALELASRNIRVNSVLPAVVETEMSSVMLESIGEEAKESVLKMHPLGFGKPEDIANTCSFLLSDASRWITGTSVIIDGGYSAQ